MVAQETEQNAERGSDPLSIGEIASPAGIGVDAHSAQTGALEGVIRVAERSLHRRSAKKTTTHTRTVKPHKTSAKTAKSAKTKAPSTHTRATAPSEQIHQRSFKNLTKKSLHRHKGGHL